MTSDVFGTAELRRTVLAAWAASPARFREDANAEDELVRGGYRDRVVVELIQNAADAASAAGTRGRVLLELTGDTLTVANTGVEVDAAAVAGLASLRASTKRGAATVGRFGVGFAAVLAVTDEPTVLTRRGGVRWSRRLAMDAAAAVPALADELERRGAAVPVLRLPFTLDEPVVAPPEGYDTAVVLALRDSVAVDLVRDLLTGVDDALVLAFGDLDEFRIVIDGEERVLTVGPAEPMNRPGGPDRHAATAVSVIPVNDRRWAVAERTGVADPALLADRPHEERERPTWAVQVAVRVDVDHRPVRPDVTAVGTHAAVIHAPTPTDDRTDLPALVLATFPVDSSRRRVAPGPLTDHLVGELGVAYADLLGALAVPETLDLVPMPLGAGDLDTALHRAVLEAVADAPLVAAARPSPDRPAQRARDAVMVDGLDGRTADGALADVIPGLPAREWWRPDVLRRLGARIRPLADVIDDLATVALEPAAWRDVYDALAGAVDTADLGALPVPLVDGRVVRGPRGVVLPAEVDTDALVALGLRVVDPAAAHPLLRRLGAVEATPASILRDPAVRAAVENADPDQPEAAAELGPAVLRLVAAAGIDVSEEPWLATLPVRNGAGEFAPVGELWLADSPVVGLLDVDSEAYTVAAAVVERHGRDLLVAVGAADSFRIVRDHDVALDDDFWHDLDGEDDYAAYLHDHLPDDGVPPVVSEFSAVADLDLVHADRWPEALRLLAADPATRAAIVDPVGVVDASGSGRRLASYTAWWLRAHARLDGRPLTALRTADADPLVAALFPAAPVDVDDTVATTLGVVRRLDDTTPDLVLDRLADEDLSMAPADLAALYAWLAAADPDDVTPPQRIRVPTGSSNRVVDGVDVVVADGPFWLPVLADHGAVLAGPESLAEVLDVASASDDVSVDVPVGNRAPVPDVVAAVLPEAAADYVEHDELIIAGVDVSWWVDQHGVVHAATTDGLASGLAWTAGRWDRRWIVAAALADPSSVDRLLAEEAFSKVDSPGVHLGSGSAR